MLFGQYPPANEVDIGYYPPQMERRDWSDSFVYVTIKIIQHIFKNLDRKIPLCSNTKAEYLDC